MFGVEDKPCGNSQAIPPKYDSGDEVCVYGLPLTLYELTACFCKLDITFSTVLGLCKSTARSVIRDLTTFRGTCRNKQHHRNGTVHVTGSAQASHKNGTPGLKSSFPGRLLRYALLLMASLRIRTS